MYRMILFLVMFAAVTAVAQEAPVSADTDSAQAQQESAERQAEEEVAEGVPEAFDPTDEFSKDNSENFPVDI